MQHLKTYLLIFSLLFFASLRTYSQEEAAHNEDEPIQHHKLTLGTGYGLVQKVIHEDGKKEFGIIPILGLNYEYWFNHKIGLGLHNDLELSSYVVEDEEGEHIDRENAISTSLVFLYEPIEGWTVFAGPGYEFEKGNSFALFKIGTDLTKNFQDGWSAGICVVYDFKKVNSSLIFGLLVSKRFGK